MSHVTPFFCNDIVSTSGKEIHIEQRPANELTCVNGQRIAAEGIEVLSLSLSLSLSLALSLARSLSLALALALSPPPPPSLFTTIYISSCLRSIDLFISLSLARSLSLAPSLSLSAHMHSVLQFD